MKIYKIWSLSKIIWILLGILFFIVAFYSRNTDTQVLLFNIIGAVCILSALLTRKAFYVTLSNGKFSKTTYFVFKVEVDVNKITKLEIVWQLGYELRIRDSSEYQMLMIKLPNYHYHSKTLAELIRDLKELKPDIELDKSCQDLLKTGKLNLPKLYLWERWS